MRANELIRKKRIESGMSDSEVAARVGLSVSEYGDVEQHEDEFISSLSLSKAKALGTVLRIPLTDLLALEPLSRDSAAALSTNLANLPRAQLLRTQRSSIGLSQTEVADAIGFDQAAIQQAETDDSYLDTLPIVVLAELAKQLRLPLERLLA